MVNEFNRWVEKDNVKKIVLNVVMFKSFIFDIKKLKFKVIFIMDEIFEECWCYEMISFFISCVNYVE